MGNSQPVCEHEWIDVTSVADRSVSDTSICAKCGRVETVDENGELPKSSKVDPCTEGHTLIEVFTEDGRGTMRRCLRCDHTEPGRHPGSETTAKLPVAEQAAEESTVTLPVAEEAPERSAEGVDRPPLVDEKPAEPAAVDGDAPQPVPKRTPVVARVGIADGMVRLAVINESSGNTRAAGRYSPAVARRIALRLVEAAHLAETRRDHAGLVGAVREERQEESPDSQ